MVLFLQQSQLKHAASRHYSSEMKAHVHTEACSGVFPAALLETAQMFINRSTTGPQMSKLWHIHPKEYYSAMIRLIHATSGVNLKRIMLSEGSQAQKEWFVFNYMISFIGHSGKGKTISKETDQWWSRSGIGSEFVKAQHKGIFRGWGNFYFLTAVMVTRLHKLTEHIFTDLYCM